MKIREGRPISAIYRRQLTGTVESLAQILRKQLLSGVVNDGE
jgi:hypothetical protein